VHLPGAHMTAPRAARLRTGHDEAQHPVLVLRRQVLPLRRVHALHGRIQRGVVVVVLPRGRLQCKRIARQSAIGSVAGGSASDNFFPASSNASHFLCSSLKPPPRGSCPMQRVSPVGSVPPTGCAHFRGQSVPYCHTKSTWQQLRHEHKYEEGKCALKESPRATDAAPWLDACGDGMCSSGHAVDWPYISFLGSRDAASIADGASCGQN